jgi:hypothetical protein
MSTDTLLVGVVALVVVGLCAYLLYAVERENDALRDKTTELLRENWRLRAQTSVSVRPLAARGAPDPTMSGEEAYHRAFAEALGEVGGRPVGLREDGAPIYIDRERRHK